MTGKALKGNGVPRTSLCEHSRKGLSEPGPRMGDARRASQTETREAGTGTSFWPFDHERV